LQLVEYSVPLAAPGFAVAHRSLALLRCACLWLLAYDHPDALSDDAVAGLVPSFFDESAGESRWPGLHAALRRDVLGDARESSERVEADRAILEGFARELLALREAPEREHARAARKAVARGGTALVVIAGLLAAGANLVSYVAAGPDLALGRPWKTSSTLLTCDPAHSSCGGQVTEIFFHTRDEDSPWISFDLGSDKTVKRVDVRNRLDCCQDRAVPLVVEVSDDEAHWTQVAWRDAGFTRWTARFRPVHARYVRLRASRHTTLHLEGVAIH
jgi:hypothetical protein